MKMIGLVVGATRQRLTSGQVVLEYFLLFAVIIVLTLVGLTTLDDDAATSLQGFFQSAAEKMATPDVEGGWTGDPGPGEPDPGGPPPDDPGIPVPF